MRWRRFRPRRSVDSDANGDVGDPFARDRARMVHEQLEARGIRDPELLRAFNRVPRHTFVESTQPYGDHALPVGAGQTISQPYVVAAMTTAGRPERGWDGARALEIGTGSGYGAAILAELGARVTSVERHAELADGARERLAAAGYGERVRVVVGDGSAGWPENAPYDAILVTAAGPRLPRPLVEQLEPRGGRIVMPVGSREHQMLTIGVRRDDELLHRELDPVVFVPLIGEHGFPD